MGESPRRPSAASVASPFIRGDEERVFRVRVETVLVRVSDHPATCQPPPATHALMNPTDSTDIRKSWSVTGASRRAMSCATGADE